MHSWFCVVIQREHNSTRKLLMLVLCSVCLLTNFHDFYINGRQYFYSVSPFRSYSSCLVLLLVSIVKPYFLNTPPYKKKPCTCSWYTNYVIYTWIHVIQVKIQLKPRSVCFCVFCHWLWKKWHRNKGTPLCYSRITFVTVAIIKHSDCTLKPMSVDFNCFYSFPRQMRGLKCHRLELSPDNSTVMVGEKSRMTNDSIAINHLAGGPE